MSDNSLSNHFWSENLQESIQIAGREAKTLLCFVTDDSEESKSWEDILGNQEFKGALRASTIRLRLQKDTQEFSFLNGVCPIENAPALVLINGGQIEEKLESPHSSSEQLKKTLTLRYAASGDVIIESGDGNVEDATTEYCLKLTPSTGRMRLPNNAYDSLRARTEELQRQNISAKNILEFQLRLLDNVPALKPTVRDIRADQTGTAPELSDDTVDRLLNTPASMLQPSQSSLSSSTSIAGSSRPPTTTVLTPTSSVTPSATAARGTNGVSSLDPANSVVSPPQSTAPAASRSQQSQRADYLRQQREREAFQRGERERIKAQIKADREERRRLDSVRKQTELDTLRQQNSTTANPSSTDTRIQVRTFDGSTLRTTFSRTATITTDVRPWIDRTNEDANKAPYNLKLVLTPLPNRNIEASEEEIPLPDLGIVGSATLIMVPVKGFVDSYSGASTGMSAGLLGTLISSSGSIIGSVVNGVTGMLGWPGSSGASTSPAAAIESTQDGNRATGSGTNHDSGSGTAAQVKIRTLADQRAEESRKRGNQLYNGNSLDFQGRKDNEGNDMDGKED